MQTTGNPIVGNPITVNPIVGNPSWQVEVEPATAHIETALITVTHPRATNAPTLRPVQQLRLPLADLPELAALIADVVAQAGL